MEFLVQEEGMFRGLVHFSGLETNGTVALECKESVRYVCLIIGNNVSWETTY